MLDTQQTEKNFLNINPVKFQTEAPAVGSGQIISNGPHTNKVTISSAGGGPLSPNEYDTAQASQEAGKNMNKFNMRMSKYGQNQFRPSAIINSVTQA